MGDEITHSHFSKTDFERFGQRLQAETRLLGEWFRDKAFSDQVPVCGLELEAWLIDGQGMPAPLNQAFLEKMDSIA